MGRIPHVAKAILLYLDPRDLKSFRLVSKDCDNLTQTLLWESKPGRKQLEKLLERRWKQVMPWRRSVLVGTRVSHISCNDQYLAIMWHQNNYHHWLRLYNLPDLSPHRQIYVDNIFFVYCGAISQDIIAVISDRNIGHEEMRVWRLNTLEEMEPKRMKNVNIRTIKVCLLYTSPSPRD